MEANNIENAISVAILMSTYNGDKYLEDQIESVFKQSGVKITLYVRDDGSKDSTVTILNRLCKKYDIRIIRGDNIGWRKSFLELIKIVPEEYDYYAFSDQDDIWLEHKIVTSVDKLRDFQKPALYCSAQTLVDANLVTLKKELHKIPRNYKQAMTNISCRGCTEVFNRQLLMMMKHFYPAIEFAHDRWVARVAAYVGNIVFDNRSYILYRQHESNSAGNNYHVGLKAKILRALNNYKNHDFYYWYAKELLEGYSEYIPEDRKQWLWILVSSRNNVFSKMKLLFSKDFISESWVGTALLKFIMIFGICQRA